MTYYKTLKLEFRARKKDAYKLFCYVISNANNDNTNNNNNNPEHRICAEISDTLTVLHLALTCCKLISLPW
jgi:hypothetical protein